MNAVQNRVPGITAASPVFLPVIERVALRNGKVRAFQVMGVYPAYRQLRNLAISSGRFFDQEDADSYSKVGILNAHLATQLFGSAEVATGKTIQVGGLPFVVIGTFREQVDTFGQTEISKITMLVPPTVVRYFQPSPMVKQIFFSAANPSSVPEITARAKAVIQGRIVHRPSTR